MVTLIIKRIVKIPFEYVSKLEIEESARVKRVSGTLIEEGVSKNGVWYNIPLLEDIVSQAENLPLYYGTERRINPNTGLLTPNMHKKGGEPIGRILKCWIEEGFKKKVRFLAEIFEEWADKIKQGFRVSIGGYGFGNWIVDPAKKLIMKLAELELTHVQVLSPETPSGVEAAQIESIEESLGMFIQTPQFTKRELAALILALYSKELI